MIVLSFHTPDEWAEVRRAGMIALGCSDGYADRVADEIRAHDVQGPERLGPGDVWLRWGETQ